MASPQRIGGHGAGLPLYGGGASGPMGKVAILAPLSGANGERGQALVNAAKLALSPEGSPALDVRDTAGTPGGAAAAAAQAIAEGDKLIIGPLTSAETAAVASVAQKAGVPVLAFTNDPSQARPGVWTLGLTASQQVGRVVSASTSQGKNRFAALLPQSDFGQAMANALTSAASTAGGPPPMIYRYEGGMNSMSAAVREVSAYSERRGPLDAEIRAAKARHDAEGRQQAADLARRDVPPPPFDALLLADTGERLATLTSLLPYYDVGPGDVRLMGPSLWAAPGARAGAALGRAWFAAPDPAARATFDQQYSAKFGSPAPGLADIAFDAASIARVLARDRGYGMDSLTRSEGFVGVDGVLALKPDGTVLRGLALFELQDGNPVIIDPAPSAISGSGT